MTHGERIEGVNLGCRRRCGSEKKNVNKEKTLQYGLSLLNYTDPYLAMLKMRCGIPNAYILDITVYKMRASLNITAWYFNVFNVLTLIYIFCN